MACDVCNFYFLFWAIFLMFTPPHHAPPSAWRYHFTDVHQKLGLHDILFLRYGAQWTGRQTERVTQR